jgi:hypothetical protein
MVTAAAVFGDHRNAAAGWKRGNTVHRRALL